MSESLYDSKYELELKNWLKDRLKDLCPADPVLLSDYVIALVHSADKDSLAGSLRDGLSEFLGDNTEIFVSSFSNCLKTGEYKPKAPTSSITSKPVSNNNNISTAATKKATSTTTPSSSTTTVEDSDPKKRKFESNNNIKTNDKTEGLPTKKTKPTGSSTTSTSITSKDRLERDSRDTSRGKYQDNGSGTSKYSSSDDRYSRERGGRRDTRDNGRDSRDSRDSRGGRDYNGRDSRDSRYSSSSYNRDSSAPPPPPRKNLEGEVVKDKYGNDIIVLNKDLLDDPNVVRLPSTNTLTLTNVPPELNTLPKIFGYFKKFGHIVNVMIKKHNNRAFVQFSDKESGQNAIQSPTAVLGNRFIQVGWAKRNPNELKVDYTSNVPPEEEEKKKEKLIQTNEITKKNEELLAQQLSTYKILVEKLEGLPEGSSQKKELAELIKKLSDDIQKSIESQKLILEKMSEATKPKHFQQIMFFKKKQEEMKQKKLEDSISEITAGESVPEMSTSSYRGRGRGRGGFIRGRGGRGGLTRSLSIDNRTSTLHVSNIPEQKQNPEELQNHFGKYGAEKLEMLGDGSCIVKFDSRQNATTALKLGKELDGQPLIFRWKESNNDAQQNNDQPTTSNNENNSTI